MKNTRLIVQVDSEGAPCRLYVLFEDGPDILERLPFFCLLVGMQSLWRFPERRGPRACTSSPSSLLLPTTRHRSRPGFPPPMLSRFLWFLYQIIVGVQKLPLLVRVDHKLGFDGRLVPVPSIVPGFIKILFFPLAKDDIISLFYTIYKLTPSDLENKFL